jgi:hypothetical protein
MSGPAAEAKARIQQILNELGTARFSILGARQLVTDSIAAIRRLEGHSDFLDRALEILVDVNDTGMHETVDDLQEAHELVATYKDVL